MKKNFIQSIWNFVGFPLRAFILNEEAQKKFGFTTLKEERFLAVLPFLNGKCLDVGCGNNELINLYKKNGGDGIGVDVFPFKGVQEIVDTANLPYHNEEFDTVTIVAALNHIPRGKRSAVLSEVHRILKNDSRLIITMINGTIGWFCHKLMWWDFDQNQRGMDTKEENYGLSNKYVVDIIQQCGFRFIKRKSFVYGLNNVFIFEKDKNFVPKA